MTLTLIQSFCFLDCHVIAPGHLAKQPAWPVQSWILQAAD